MARAGAASTTPPKRSKSLKRHVSWALPKLAIPTTDNKAHFQNSPQNTATHPSNAIPHPRHSWFSFCLPKTSGLTHCKDHRQL